VTVIVVVIQGIKSSKDLCDVADSENIEDSRTFVVCDLVVLMIIIVLFRVFVMLLLVVSMRNTW
jgi:uncharacterized protein HemY